MFYLKLILTVLVLGQAASGQHVFLSLAERVKPLQTTRKDVESMVRSKAVEIGGRSHYRWKGARIEIAYTAQECFSSDGKSVSVDLVRYAHATSNKSLFLDELPYDLSNFEKTDTDKLELPGMFDYSSVRYGIGFTTESRTRSGRELIMSFSIHPAGKISTLRC